MFLQANVRKWTALLRVCYCFVSNMNWNNRISIWQVLRLTWHDNNASEQCMISNSPQNSEIFIQQNFLETTICNFAHFRRLNVCIIKTSSFTTFLKPTHKKQSYVYVIQTLRSLHHQMSQNLTHWGWDKMATIFQTTFSNAFSWMKIYELWLRFHWRLFPGVHLTTFKHWFKWWLGADQAISHYLNLW